MIQIRINNEPVDMPTNTNVGFEMLSPYFSFDKIVGSHARPFTLPFTPKNRRIFDWYHRPESTADTAQTYYAEKYADSHCVEKGIVMVDAVTEQGYSIIFVKNLSDLFGIYGNTLLNQLPLGSEVIPNPLPTNPQPTTHNYCFPTIQNPNFYGDNPYAGFVNQFSAGAYTTTGPKVPMLYLSYVLQSIATLCGFSITGSFLSHPAYSRLVVYNTYCLDGLLNINYANHLPELRVMELFLELRNLLNLAIDIDMRSRTMSINFLEDILTATPTHDWSPKVQWKLNKKPTRTTRLKLEPTLDDADATTKNTPLGGAYLTPTANPDEDLFAIKTKFSTLAMQGTTPYTEQIGISPQFAQKPQKFAPRLLFHLNNNLASNQLGAFGLLPTSLFANHFTIYQSFRRQSFETTQDIALTTRDLTEFAFHHKVHIAGQNYLVQQLSTTLPVKTLTKAQLIRVP